jgi:hypothetical protein
VKIVRNTSIYETRALHRLIERVLREAGTFPLEYRRALRIEVLPARGAQSRGRAVYNGRTFRLWLSKTVTPSGVAALAIHEAWHNRGSRKHTDMPEYINKCWSTKPDGPEGAHVPRWPDLIGTTLPLKRDKPKPTVAVKRAVRRARITDALRRWQRKAKLASTMQKKYIAALARLDRAERLAAGVTQGEATK